MKRDRNRRQWFLLAAIAACIVLATWIGIRTIRIESDIAAVLPQSDPVVRDARAILSENPILDRIVIDLSLKGEQTDTDLLLGAAERIEAWIDDFELIRIVDTGFDRQAGPLLLNHFVDRFPLLFAQQDLESEVMELLRPERIREAMEINRLDLAGLDGIGQADLIAADPLRFREILLKRLSAQIPSDNVEIVRGRLMTGDRRHLLLLAEPAASATDSRFARAVEAFFESIPSKLEDALGGDARAVDIVHFGSYRAALDNETIVRRDAARAVAIATCGIAILLLLCFPRPAIGILAFVPAVAGAGMALFVYSILFRTISSVALGFGGALISITIDASIAFLLFMDRTEQSSGDEVSRKVWSVSLFAAITSAGAFAALAFSGFPMLKQMGIFAALGIAFSFAFVHLAFPLLLSGLSPARRPALVPIEKLLGERSLSRKGRMALLALVIVLILAPFSKPVFKIDMSAMNTVEQKTLEAEQTVMDHWGGMLDRVYLLVRETTTRDLHQAADRLADFLDQQVAAGNLEPALSPSEIFPGPDRAESNLSAWKRFWTAERTAETKRSVKRAAVEFGFSEGAFDQFFRRIEEPDGPAPPIPEALFAPLGVSRDAATGEWTVLSSVARGPSYDAESFYGEASRAGLMAYEPHLFADRLARLLASTFVRMLLIIGASMAVLISLLFMDWKLVALSFTPLAFALVCTLGTLKLIGRPLDIPGLMLSVVILGMGIDYSLYFVRSRQRLLDLTGPGLPTIRAAVFLNAGSTILGMFSLAIAQHAVLHSAGITALLGIVYVLAGTFAILPPLLDRLYAVPDTPTDVVDPGSSEHLARVARRYAHLEAYPRLFARFKIRTDPMFKRLADFVPRNGTVIDVGCGYGVQAAWLLSAFPGLRLLCMEPDPDRARIASRVVGEQGTVVRGSASDLPLEFREAHAALVLDVAHHLSTKELEATLSSLFERLRPGGTLVIRTSLLTAKRIPWERWIEKTRLSILRKEYFFRTEAEVSDAIKSAGFVIETIESAAQGRDETWFVARKNKGSAPS